MAKSEIPVSNILIKSIKVEENGKIKENISFPSFKFNELVKEDWENSSIKELVENKFLFVFYKKEKGNVKLEKSIAPVLLAPDVGEPLF